MAFDPATWGRTRVPSGPLEAARVAAHTKQQNRIRVNLTSNTTLVGLGPDARIVNAHVRVNNIQNVIIRNITFEDAFDCFPQWDPTNGALGNWNSSYDNISLTGATNVWVAAKNRLRVGRQRDSDFRYASTWATPSSDSSRAEIGGISPAPSRTMPRSSS